MPLRSLVWFLTEACNLRCSYCYLAKQPRRSRAEVGEAAVDLLLARSGEERRLHLRFFGGEPMLEMDLIEKVVGYARRRAEEEGKSLRFDMVSNVTLADPKRVERLARLGVAVIASLDGGRATMARNRGETEDLTDKVRNLVASGVARVCRMTVAPGHRDLAADLEYLLDLGFEAVQMATATNVPWTREELGRVYDETAGFYVARARRGAVPPLTTTNRLLVAWQERGQGLWPGDGSPFCEAGRAMLGVGTDGRLYPCHRFVQSGPFFDLGSVFVPEAGAEASGTAWCATRPARADCETCPARPFCVGSCLAANCAANGDPGRPEERHCLDLRAHLNAVATIHDTLIAEDCPAFSQFLEAGLERARRKRLNFLLEEAGLFEEAGLGGIPT